MNFNPLQSWQAEIKTKRDQLAAQHKETETAKAAAKARRETLKPSSGRSDFERLKNTFNNAYTPQEWMTSAGYDQRGNTFRHPNHKSGSFSASVKADANGVLRVNALSPNDPLYSAGQGAHDAFSTFCTLFHGGNNNEAVIEAGDKLLTINGDPYNEFIRREYMQNKAKQDEQAGEKMGQDSEGDMGHNNEADQDDKKTKKSTLDVVFADELSDTFNPPDEIIEDMITAGSGSVLYGPSNSGKTFVVVDMGCAIALGKPWLGKRTEQGLVIYLATESPSSVETRLQAYQKQYGVKVPNFAIVRNPIDLFNSGDDTKKIIHLVKQLEEERGVKAAFIVGDTLSRISAGANENLGQDMSIVVRHFDRIRSKCDAHFMLIHHSGKSIAAGARGWSGVQAAIDTEIEVTDKGFEGRRIEVTKQRDLPTKGLQIGFALESINMGVTKWGKPATSCFVVPADIQFESAEKGIQLTAKQADILTAAYKTIAELPEYCPPDVKELFPDSPWLCPKKCFQKDNIKVFAYPFIEGKPRQKTSKLGTALEGLVAKRKLGFYKDFYWIIGEQTNRLP